MKLTVVGLCVLVSCMCASAQQTIQVLKPAWEGLAPEDKAEIQKSKIIDLRDVNDYAVIIDNQGVNESNPGTQGGAVLGGARANAAYIDRALKPQNNYSAKNQLAIGILGALIGSTLDAPATSQFHFRYALRRSDGEIEYRDIVQSDSFRHPVGICIELATVRPVSQTMCGQTSDDLRRVHLAMQAPASAKKMTHDSTQPNFDNPPDKPLQVQCKLRDLAPVLTSAEKCKLIQGISF